MKILLNSETDICCIAFPVLYFPKLKWRKSNLINITIRNASLNKMISNFEVSCLESNLVVWESSLARLENAWLAAKVSKSAKLLSKWGKFLLESDQVHSKPIP